MSRALSSVPAPTLGEDELAALERAWLLLERPSLAARLSSILGTPLEQILRQLPDQWSGPIRSAAETAILRAYDLAERTLEPGSGPVAGSAVADRLAVAASGAAGGFFGLPALLVELPVTTLLMLRAIAQVAQRHGEQPRSPRTRLACLQVFALGGRSPADDHAELGYYELRLALAWQLTPSAAGAGAALPAPLGFLRAVAARFGMAVTDKVAAQAVPVVGALAGAAVNLLFFDHFQAVAEGHFAVRRLERRYGRATVEAAYRAISARMGEDRPLKRAPRRSRNRRAASARPG